uniref:Uncharacterized protein n=1 Tax=Salix viminalis TaxID=40686 RepID=A0A6N2LDP3_SALVM
MDCLAANEAEENNLHSAVPSPALSSCQGLALPFFLGRSPLTLNDMSCLLPEVNGSDFTTVKRAFKKIQKGAQSVAETLTLQAQLSSYPIHPHAAFSPLVLSTKLRP